MERLGFRSQSKFEHFSFQKRMRYLPNLTKIAEQMVLVLLPDNISLVFDEWTTGSVQSLSSFAFFSSWNSNGFSTRIFRNTASWGSNDDNCWWEYCSYEICSWDFREKWNKVVEFIVHNVSTNKSIAKKQNISLIGCDSHRFNLSLKDILSDHESILANINALMVNLKKRLQRVRFQIQT